MRYLGGKKRSGKEISEILKKYGPPDKVKGYLEPFCGALGVTVHMVNDYHCTVSDVNKSLILLWKEVKAGTFKYPRSVSKQTWVNYKNDPKDSAMKAYVGFSHSFGGSWFDGYTGDYFSNNKLKSSNNESTRSISKMNDYIKKINILTCKPYDKWEPVGMLIYCDPPYKNTKQYRGTPKFDSEKFWDIVRKWSKKNIVLVSEFNAPKDFKCIWKKQKYAILDSIHNKKKLTEKLFICKKN